MDLLIASLIVTGLVSGGRYFPLRRIIRHDVPRSIQFFVLVIIWAATVSVLFKSWQFALPDWAIYYHLTIMNLLIVAVWTIGLVTWVAFAGCEYLDDYLDNRDRRIIAESEGDILRDGLKK